MKTELIINFLTELGKQITGLAKDVYAIYVKQAWSNGIVSLVVAVIVLVVAIIASQTLYKAEMRNKEEYYKGMYLSCMWIVIIVCAGIFLIAFMSGLRHLLNPNYYAIQDIISQIK